MLTTKLHVPRPRRGTVARRRLLEELDRGREEPLTLVSAPAGFGKTTLVTQWLEHAASATNARGFRVAWLSLDDGDNDPRSFWSYLVAALRTAAPEVGEAELALLRGGDAPPIRRLLTTVLNDLGSLPFDVVLVLDDYHLVEAQEVQQELAFLVEHLPPQLHLVVATRTDPALPLARLRARGALAEVRAADLRFTAGEAATYLNGAMGLTLTPPEVSALEDRTEGWIAALQLAALSMQGRDDVAGFVAGFTGDDRYVVDYLVEEVLQRQPEPLQAFLLQTSVLDRLTGALCDAVTGQAHGKATLEALDRANLFLVPLDDRRHWYRYHHLFADVLRARLLDEQPDVVPALHRRASGWHEQHGDRAAAIRHALTASDFERAAELVEREFPASRRDRQESTLLGWLSRLPDDVIRGRPVLCVVHAGTLLSTGTVEGVEQRLRDAERWVGTTAGRDAGAVPTGAAVVDEEEYRRVSAWVAIYRAAMSLLRGDHAATIGHARAALGRREPKDEVAHAAASALLGLASWTEGELDAAHAAYVTCSAIFLREGYLSDVLGCAIPLGDIRMTQGRLREAEDTFQQALHVTGQGGDVQRASAVRGAADVYIGLATLHREHDDLAAARECLGTSRALGEHNGLPQNRYRWRVAMARVLEAEGDLDGAAALLDEAEQVYVGDFLPDVRPVAALKARSHLARGRLQAAADWVRRRELTPEDPLSYLKELEHVTLARVLIARSATERSDELLRQASALLDRLLEAAEAGGRWGTAIEILVLQALAHQSLEDTEAALAPLQRALTIGEPEGYVRVFLDEGGPMVRLLETAAERGIGTTYVRSLLGRSAGVTTSPERRPGPAPANGLVEALSERELVVLRLLATDLTGPEIARELVVSLNTVRTHTRNVYAKLGVSGRRAAVRRAEELDLVQVGRRRS